MTLSFNTRVAGLSAGQVLCRLTALSPWELTFQQQLTPRAEEKPWGQTGSVFQPQEELGERTSYGELGSLR